MQSSFIRRTLPQLIFVVAVLTAGVFLSAKDSANTQAIGTFGSSTALTANYCNRFPTGTVTGSAGLTVTDTSSGGVSGGWVTDEWTTPSDHLAKMLSGPGIGQSRLISANTATTFTVSVAWTAVGGWTAPLVGERYEIILLPTDPNCGDGVGALALDAPLDLTTRLTIGLTDYNFSFIATTTPAAGFVAPGPGGPGFIGGTHPALGDLVGALISDTSLGLTNNACSSDLTVDFKFMQSTVDNSVGNLFYPLLVAQTSNNGILENYQTDDGGANGPDDVVGGGDDIAGTLPVNGLPAAVERYPSYLNDVFDPDWINNGPDDIEDGAPQAGATIDDVNGPTPPVQPLQRLRGGVVVSNSSVELDLLIFAPGVIAAAFPAPHPFNDLTSDMGYTTVTVLQNPTARAAPSAITDFCANLATLTTVWGEARTNPCNGTAAAPCNTIGGINTPITGNNNGLDRARTPAAAGTYLNVGVASSLRDKDGDGYENALDTCAELVNTDLSPRLDSGPDTDMIDGVCDPNNAVNNPNQDGDFAANLADWQNAGDNCPIVSNGDQLETELLHSYYEANATNPAPQGGPKTDGIGDLCDGDDVRANGDFISILNVQAKCYGGTDADDDGYCTAVGSGIAATDPNDADAAKTPEDYDLTFATGVAHSGSGDNPPERQPVQVCNDGIDNDGDTLIDNLDLAVGNSTCRPVTVTGHPNFPACPNGPALTAFGCALDADGDGFTNEAERHVGTNALARCGTTAVPAQSGAWPGDFVSGAGSVDKMTLTDLTSFLAPVRRLDTFPGHVNFNVRWDLKPGSGSPNWIILDDLTSLLAGASGNPPMNGGGRVFGTAFVCSVHPIYGN
jgi:hypothetical protein